MKLKYLIIAAAVVLLSVPAFADEYSFKVTNNTDTKITKILVSEDGEDYGFFDIGAGINPGKTVTLEWDSSTNGESCEQYFKAVFANKEESEAQKFDFCEEGVTLEFE
jgi:myo-inositol-hexaphosphate 3-phosphohydrolase